MGPKYFACKNTYIHQLSWRSVEQFRNLFITNGYIYLQFPYNRSFTKQITTIGDFQEFFIHLYGLTTRRKKLLPILDFYLKKNANSELYPSAPGRTSSPSMTQECQKFIGSDGGPKWTPALELGHFQQIFGTSFLDVWLSSSLNLSYL